MIGIISSKAELKEYNEEYKTVASHTIHTLENLIGEKVIKIEHVGSTAIIGIQSKPIIDIAVGISSFAIIGEIKDILESHQFIFSKVKLNNTVVTFICESDGKRTHNIHFVIFMEDRWKEFVWFKEYLNANPTIAKDYEKLKIDLSKKYRDDIHAYTANKRDFISGVLKVAEKEYQERDRNFL